MVAESLSSVPVSDGRTPPMGRAVAEAMDKVQTRWTSRGIFSQWFDYAKSFGWDDLRAYKFAASKDEQLRQAEGDLEAIQKRIESLVALGADVPPPGAFPKEGAGGG